MGVIIFNGQSSKDFHIQVEHPPGYEFPERDYESVHVPGRNGDVIIEYESYKNVDVIYEISVGDQNKSFYKMAHDISVWLHSASNYARLEDSYEPDYYRMALYTEAASIENILNHGGKVEITFNCKPQKFLKTGDRTKAFKKSGIIKNPTTFESYPIITVKGAGDGSITIGSYVVDIKNINSSIVIDCDYQDAYSGSVNKNQDVTLRNGAFPRLVPGNNTISFSGGVTSLEVIPKWWTL